MGASTTVQTTVNKIRQNVVNTLENSAEASSGATCNLTIGSIKATGLRNCTLKIENMCTAKAEAAVSAMTSAIIQSYRQLDNESKAEAAKLFTINTSVQTTVTDIEDNFTNHVENKCRAQAEAEVNLKIKDIQISECISDFGIMEITFVNAGNAHASCVMELITDMEAEAVSDISNRMSAGLDITSILIVIMVGVVILGGIYLLNKRIYRPDPEDQRKLKLIEKIPFTYYSKNSYNA